MLALPGVGPYTAGAVCSIVFDQPTPSVDGNVLRLVSRLTDDAAPVDDPAYKKRVQNALREIYPAQAGAFTQALMELGATLCGPNKKPDCENCPCKAICQGYLNGTAETLPARLPKREKRVQEKTVFILSCDGRYALRKRPERGLLAGLWEFPNVAGKLDIEAAVGEMERQGVNTKEIIMQVERKHIFTHIIWDMRGIYMEVSQCGGDFLWLTPQQINQETALPTAFRLFWEEVPYV